MDLNLITLNLKKEIAKHGEVSLTEMGFLDGHIAEIVEHLKSDKNYEIVFTSNDTIIKKKQTQEPLPLEAALNPIYQQKDASSNTTKNILQKTGLWIASHIVQFILSVVASIVAAYFIFKYGWN